MPNHAEQLAQELNLNLKNVQGAIELIDQGNTIPFIARYRKEATGSMDDQVLRNRSIAFKGRTTSLYGQRRRNTYDYHLSDNGR